MTFKAYKWLRNQIIKYSSLFFCWFWFCLWRLWLFEVNWRWCHLWCYGIARPSLSVCACVVMPHLSAVFNSIRNKLLLLQKDYSHFSIFFSSYFSQVNNFNFWYVDWMNETLLWGVVCTYTHSIWMTLFNVTKLMLTGGSFARPQTNTYIHSHTFVLWAFIDTTIRSQMKRKFIGKWSHLLCVLYVIALQHNNISSIYCSFKNIHVFLYVLYDFFFRLFFVCFVLVWLSIHLVTWTTNTL